jgi:uncharacterized protein (DUF885 family)
MLMQLRDTRRLAPLLAALLAGCAAGAGAGAGPAAERVDRVADRYVREYFRAFPEGATSQGVPGAEHGALPDNSLEGVRRWAAREDELLAELRAIDPAALDGTDAALTYAFLRDRLEAAEGYRVCRMELWDVSPTYTGWQSSLALLATLQPVGSPESRAAALSRARALPRYLDNEIANLREGVRQGYTAPRSNVRSVIEQMDALLASPPAESPFLSPAARDSSPEFRRELTAVVQGEVRGAIRRYRDHLANEYLPAAREPVGVSANPQGEACYRAAVRYHTSLSMTPEEIHQTGLREMARIRAEMRTIGERSFGTGDVSALLQTLRTDPRYTFRSREQIIRVAQDAVDRARRAVPRWFGIVPEADVVIQPYAPFQEKGAPLGQYNSASDDGSRPGVYLINTYQPEKQSRAGLESVAFHEAYPGHHLQISIAKEREGAHPVTRYFSSSGFTEGWGLYAERLADEMGLFTSDVDRMGLLSNEAHRAARLVVDAGMHALGWSRQRAIDYLLENTTLAATSAAAEVDRYVATPGQASSYMLGNLEIRRLRELQRQRLGDRFDIRAFHDRVLEDGGVTLGMLRTKME